MVFLKSSANNAANPLLTPYRPIVTSMGLTFWRLAEGHRARRRFGGC